jgi:hypothetical protein
VDGDEIYDPEGLKAFRRRLESGEFDRDWCVFGNVLNVRSLDTATMTASGHLAPPCRSMTKLYNFAAIRSWQGPTQERLHGGTVEFLPGYHDRLRRNLHESEPWEDSPFRCLHLCFLQRSPLDPQGAIRKNIMDVHSWTLAKAAGKLGALLAGRKPVDWKEEKYARGGQVSKDVAAFFPPEEPGL